MSRLIATLSLLPMLTACSGVIRPALEPTDAATRLEQVTHTGNDELDPAVSPDGTALAYETRASVGSPSHVEIMWLQPHGKYVAGEVAFSSGKTIGMEPAWKPDGSGVVFVTTSGNQAPKLVETFEHGTGYAPLQAKSDDVYFAGAWPTISPKGTIAVSFKDVETYETSWPITREYDRALGISSMPGAGITILGRGNKPAWSPDGTRLAFVRLSEGHSHLFISNNDGSDAHQITEGSGDDEAPAWSPDGTRLVFCSGPSTPTASGLPQANLFTVNRDGSGLVQLTEGDRFACRPSWAKDGNIYFHLNATDRFHIWRIRPK
jgi:TolB protein